jgi:hypothetical protein
MIPIATNVLKVLLLILVSHGAGLDAAAFVIIVRF